MQCNESYPYHQAVEAAFRSLGESWAVARNVSGTLTVYLLYHRRFYPMGSPASVAGLSLGALGEAIALAKRHSELGHQTLPGGVLEPEQVNDVPDTQIVPSARLQEIRSLVQHHVPQHTVPLARLRFPLGVLHQMVQLPADYVVKQVAVEEDALCIYCLVPECTAMDAVSGNPAIHADYRVEERDGVSWRALISIHIEEPSCQKSSPHNN